MPLRAVNLYRSAALAGALAIAGIAAAQVGAPAATTATRPAPAQPAKAAPQPAQEESLSYLGRKLWFEVKRRLNLTTEQEEEQNARDQKPVDLKVGSFRVQRPVATATPAATATPGVPAKQ